MPPLKAVFTSCTPGTPGCAWQNGDVITYSQTSWGELATTAGQHLNSSYMTVYSPSGILDLGLAGSSMTFTAASHLRAYLPASGSDGTLTGINDNPTSTTAGTFGGDVVALKLNVDFADAGITNGASPSSFGDLTLCGYTTLPLLNDTTVRELLGNVNSLLGNGPGIYNIGLLAPVIDALNQAFQDGIVTTYANDHLYADGCP